MRRIAIATALLVLAGCPKKTEPPPPNPGDNLPTTKIAGKAMTGEVTVYYDDVGIPNIYTAKDGDAVFALGYLQARDRLFQMDLYRRYSRGRLSEIIGSAAEPTDVFYRTIFTGPDGNNVIDTITAALKPETTALLQRYADGVNYFLDDLKNGKNGAELPGEYKLPLISVEKGDIAPWVVADSVGIARLQTWLLSERFGDELDLSAAYAAGIPPNLIGDLARFAPAEDSFIVPRSIHVPHPWKPDAALLRRLASTGPNIAGAQAFYRGVSRPPWAPQHDRAGSNNWVIGSKLTGKGAMLANDPHLTLGNPATFHMAHLATDTLDVAGVVFPGAPGVPIGHNAKVAWGATVVGYDVTDIYQDTFSADLKTVKFQGLMKEATIVNAVMKIRQNGVLVDKPFAINLVPWHGPVLPGSIATDASGVTTGLTLKWTGQQPTQEVQAVLDLDRAASVDEAFTALKQFRVGAQNFVLADVDGHIGYDPHADVPIRANGDVGILALSPPWLIQPGDGGVEWTGTIADADLPQSHDPAQGFIATANNDQTGTTQDNNPLNDGTYLYPTNDPGFRHKRIVERLTEKQQYNQDDMNSIQGDNVSLLARALVPGLVGYYDRNQQTIGSKGLTSYVQMLKGWTDFTCPTGLAGIDMAGPDDTDAAKVKASAACTLFSAIVPRFARKVVDDELAKYKDPRDGSTYSAASFGGYEISKYLILLTANPGKLSTGDSLCDDITTPAPAVETCDDQAIAALEEGVAFLKGQLGNDATAWRWGKIHYVYFRSPAPLASTFDHGPFARNGGLFTVDVANYGYFGDDHEVDDGANVRFTADLSDGKVKWRAVIPGGQVDKKGDANYENQVEDWLLNTPRDRPFTKDDVIAKAKSRWIFTK